jgi:hypothetical protein
VPEVEPLELLPGTADGDVVVASVDGLVALGGVAVLGDEAGGGSVDGDAEGARSLGRSPTRPVPLSEQAAARVATSANANRLESALFMADLLGISTAAGTSNRNASEVRARDRGTDARAAIA